ncbi:MAG: hypothetical protein L0H15_11900, partial [Nitrosospira sp.]|nr:hypothetical protein [Nitrosospira sp.]
GLGENFGKIKAVRNNSSNSTHRLSRQRKKWNADAPGRGRNRIITFPFTTLCKAEFKPHPCLIAQIRYICHKTVIKLQ